MITMVVLIGNSDNKLTQSEWAHYVEAMRLVIERACYIVHFFGGSSTYAPWQNVCWTIEINIANVDILKFDITNIRRSYKQDSVAVMTGVTEFI